MTKTSLNKYTRALQAMAARVGETVGGLTEAVRTPTGGQAEGGLSGAPQHLADLGTDVASQELDSALLENETYLQGEVDAALGRIAGGTYGNCERCGKSIPAARLTAVPYTRYCTACSEATHDGAVVNMNHGRPAVAFALGSNPADTHAAGTPGGGGASGGLGGTNAGRGSPAAAYLETEAANGTSDDEAGEPAEAFAGRSGGAAGGTPANKRARGGKRAAK